MKRFWIPQVIVSGMLLWALNPGNPYSYYILLRWVCCAVFAYLALQAFASGKQGWVWALGVTAAIYNPFVPVHLTREIWSVINVVTIAIAIASIFAVKTTKGWNVALRPRGVDGLVIREVLARLAGGTRTVAKRPKGTGVTTVVTCRVLRDATDDNIDGVESRDH